MEDISEFVREIGPDPDREHKEVPQSAKDDIALWSG
jgi:hypothetical protein